VECKLSYIEIFILALALSVDACVVSFAYGLTFNKNKLKNCLLLAFFTGFFQMLMPFLGYFLTTFVKSYIEPFAQLIVFIIFTFLGCKFIKEAFTKKNQPLCLGLCCLLLIGIATSIDAFSAGISLSLSGNKILKPILLIGLITFINSSLGFILGGKLKNMPTILLEVSAGILLIVLGVKALL
jgi:putative Mn2+ efflux pump MntP